MTPGVSVDGPSVDASLVIEEVARLLSADGIDAANVVNSRGKMLGHITMNDVISAMVPPKVEKQIDEMV
jgi:glycine betaine/proline transport system ATP-binding protein